MHCRIKKKLGQALPRFSKQILTLEPISHSRGHSRKVTAAQLGRYVPHDVRYWHLADIGSDANHVRF